MRLDGRHLSERIYDSLKRRHSAERRFRAMGLGAVGLALLALFTLFGTLGLKGFEAIEQTAITLDVTFDPAVIDPAGTRDPVIMAQADYLGLVKSALRDQFPEVTERSDKKELNQLISSGASFELQDLVASDPTLIGLTRPVALIASDDVDMAVKKGIDRSTPSDSRRLSDKQLDWLALLKQRDRLNVQFNTRFFTMGDSREPELAGILGAFMGSLLSLGVCFLMSFPLAVLRRSIWKNSRPRTVGPT